MHSAGAPPCPPQMKRAGVAMTNRLFPRRFFVDGIKGQRHLDKLLFVGHSDSLLFVLLNHSKIVTSNFG